MGYFERKEEQATQAATIAAQQTKIDGLNREVAALKDDVRKLMSAVFYIHYEENAIRSIFTDEPPWKETNCGSKIQMLMDWLEVEVKVNEPCELRAELVEKESD